MNIDFEFYDACYKLAAIGNIIDEHDIIIDERLTATPTVAYCPGTVFDEELDYGLGIDIYKDGKLLQSVDFDYKLKTRLKQLSIMLDKKVHIDAKIDAMNKNTPSSLLNFIKEKPVLSREERESVIKKSRELYEEIKFSQETNHKIGR